MKRSLSLNRLVLVLCSVMLVLAALVAQITGLRGLPTLAASLPVRSLGQSWELAQETLERLSSSPEDELQAAWKRAQQAGAYGFTADAEQTLIPRPLPSMIGQTNQRADWRLEGEVTLPDHARLKLRFEGAGLSAAPVELVQDGAETYMLKDGERIPVENPAGLSSPTADYLGYLAAAENVQEIGIETPGHFSGGGENSPHPPTSPFPHLAFRRYTYTINGPRFAEHVRDQTQSQFEKGATLGGQPLPPNVTLSPSPLLQRMTGHGELWVAANGLPLRQVVDLSLPEVSQEYDAQVHLVVDYDFGDADGLAAASGQAGSISGAIGRLPVWRDLAELRVSPSDAFFLLLSLRFPNAPERAGSQRTLFQPGLGRQA